MRIQKLPFGKHKRLLIFLAVILALLVPLCSALAAGVFDFGTLFRPDHDSKIYSAYKVEVERVTTPPPLTEATIIVIHQDADTDDEIETETFTVDPGPYGPYLPQTFTGYGPGLHDITSDPPEGTINAGETKTIVYNYPKTQLEVCTITYDPNGGPGPGSSDSGYVGSLYTIKSSEEADMGETKYYLFDGWNTRADGYGSKDYRAGKEITLSGDLTLYAQWIQGL
jgi:hypothetical protein